jgi:hypothetical protein
VNINSFGWYPKFFKERVVVGYVYGSAKRQEKAINQT